MKLFDNIDALLITNPTNVLYLTGFSGANPQEQEGYVVLTKKEIILLTNPLNIEAARQCLLPQRIRENKQFPAHKLVIQEIPFGKKLTAVLGEIFKAENVHKLGFEETCITVSEYKNLERELKGIALIPTEGRIEEYRQIKQPDEITAIRRAAARTDECFSHILEFLKPGVTEQDVAWEIEVYFKTRGADLAFSPIVAFGENSSMPHYSLSKNCKLKTNDVILLDFGARVDGYCADMTRVVFIGKPKEEWKRVYQAVLDTQTAALTYCAAIGSSLIRSGKQADQIARETVRKAGFPDYPHSLGHALGLDIHEAPRLSIKTDAHLKPDMVITIEPGVYMEGQYGIRIEDTVLLTPEGIEVLTKSTKKFTILSNPSRI